MNPHIKFLLFIVLTGIISGSSCITDENQPVTHRHLSTGGHTVYHVSPAHIGAEPERAIISASYDGMVICQDFQGKILWKSATGGCFPFDLAVGDTDGDGLDEAFVASGDGILYAFDHTGRPLWSFKSAAPLLAVSIAGPINGKIYIATGGIDQKIYSLNPSGTLSSEIKTRGIIRFIRSGKFLDSLNTSLAVSMHLSCRSNSDNIYLNVFNPEDLKPLHKEDFLIPFDNRHTLEHDLDLDNIAIKKSPHIGSMLAADINHDGLDEILISRGKTEPGQIYAFTGRFESIPWNFSPPEKFNFEYRDNILSYIPGKTPDEVFLAGLFGYELILYEMDGSFKKKLRSPYSYTDGVYDPVSGYYCLGSSISGGDAIHLLDINQSNWESAFETIPATGKIKQIQDNLDDLKSIAAQAENSLNRSSEKPCIILGLDGPEIKEMVSRYNLKNVDVASYHILTEQIPPDWHRDRRMPFDKSREEIVSFAREKEREGEYFVLRAGHGGSFFMTLLTLEKILQVAPNSLKGFVFAEMWPGKKDSENKEIKDLIETKLVPLAELCLKYGNRKLFLRNQRLFWNAACYIEPWQSFLFNERYKDIIVPCMEETHCRTQDISLSGRVGLWMSGVFKYHAGRAVMDNATYSRLWEWSSQRLTHHHFRAMALHASLGADYFIVHLRKGMYEDFSLFITMLDRGLLFRPKREELLSLSEVCLGMRNPSDNFYYHGDNAHDPIDFRPEGITSVFDRLDWYWSGVPILPDDFSKYGFGSKTRMLNYLPLNPHGFIASVPDDTDISGITQIKYKISTDGEFFYDDQGRQYTAAEYRPLIQDLLIKSSSNLAVTVNGEVSWTVARIDSSRIRVTLIDPGYLDPADREAEIILQNYPAEKALDILNKCELPIKNGRIEVHIPMATLSIIDLIRHVNP